MCRFIFLSVFFFSPLFLAAAQDTVTPLSDPRFGCNAEDLSSEDEELFFYSLVRINGVGEIVSYLSELVLGKWRNNRVKRFRSLFKKTRLPKYRKRLIRWRKNVKEGKQCLAGNYDPGDDDTGGGGGGGGNNDSEACSIFAENQGGVSAKIINGEKCAIGKTPVVKIRMYSGASWQGSCSGTVIHKNVEEEETIILTAAHCVPQGQFTSVKIIYDDGEEATSTEMFPHPDNLDGDAGPNDIAIIRVNSLLTTDVMEILPSGHGQVGEPLAIAGYGLVGEGQSSGDTDGLQAGFMQISQVTAEEVISEFEHPNGANTCNGDSGGPGAVERDGVWYIAAVTSYGYSQNCGPSDTSGFVKITSPSNIAFVAQFVSGLLD